MGLLDTLRAKGITVVVSSGPSQAKLVVVGEALGADEVLKGRPFAGMAGVMFDWVLRTVDVERDQVHVTNVVPVRPRDNKLENLKEIGLEVGDFIPDLLERLKKVGPNCILALGETALFALTGQTQISKWRGSILWNSEIGCKVVPSFHPSFVQRLGETNVREELTERGTGGVKYDYGAARVSLVLDTKRAAQEAKTSEVPQEDFELVSRPTLEQVLSQLEWLAEQPRVAFDIETRGTQVVCIGFSADPKKAICVPLEREFWFSELEVVKKEVGKLLWNHKGLVAQNATFDITYLMPEFPVRLLHLDTMIAHHLLFPELPHSLEFLTSVYTKIPFYKWMSKQDLFKYNCLDAVATLQVAEELEKELKERKLEDFFFGYTMPLFHMLLQMGWEGIDVDAKEMEKLDGELEAEASTLMKEIEEESGQALNVRSSKQVCDFLYRKLGLPVQFKKGKGTETADEDALDKLYKKTQNKLLFKILEARQRLNTQSKFTRAKKDWDGKIRTNYSISSTDTGRLSSKKTVFRTGLNLQNVLRESKYRRVFIAPLGEEIGEADLEQAEARLVAWFAQDERLIDFLLGGGDIHKWNASIIFGKPKEQILPDQRYFAKRVVHGFNYGLGPGHLVDLARLEANVLLTLSEAKGMRGRYFAGCPKVPEWHEEIKYIMDKGGRTLVTPFGRPRTFYGRPGPDMHRKMVAFLPQSTCVDYANTAMVRVDKCFPVGAKVLLQTHDGIVCRWKKELREECIGILRRELGTKLVIHGRELVIPVAIKVGPNWGDVKEVGK